MKHSLPDQFIPTEPSVSKNEKQSDQVNKLNILAQQDTLLPESSKHDSPFKRNPFTEQDVKNEPVVDSPMKSEEDAPKPDLDKINQMLSNPN